MHYRFRISELLLPLSFCYCISVSSDCCYIRNRLDETIVTSAISRQLSCHTFSSTLSSAEQSCGSFSLTCQFAIYILTRKRAKQFSSRRPTEPWLAIDWTQRQTAAKLPSVTAAFIAAWSNALAEKLSIALWAVRQHVYLYQAWIHCCHPPRPTSAARMLHARHSSCLRTEASRWIPLGAVTINVTSSPPSITIDLDIVHIAQ